MPDDRSLELRPEDLSPDRSVMDSAIESIQWEAELSGWTRIGVSWNFLRGNKLVIHRLGGTVEYPLAYQDVYTILKSGRERLYRKGRAVNIEDFLQGRWLDGMPASNGRQ